jgi:hypothetical protein
MSQREEKINQMGISVTIETFCSSGLVEITPVLLRNWCAAGKVPKTAAVKHGKLWYINVRPFLDWFEGRGKERAGGRFF